ncbi:ribonuclease J, partial [Candidatus Gracilibacteria bacterium]
TGSQGEQFSALARMAEGKHNAVEIIRGDTIVFSSSVVPGNEKSVVGIINKLIRLGANVITKDDGEVHTGGHAFQEEQKIMINLVKPKYFMPVFGDLYFRTLHRNTAIGLGMKDNNVLMLDNGNIVDFAPNNGNVFKSKIKVPIQEIIIDGHGMGLATSHVIKAREKMMNSGVLVLLFKVDKKTRAIMGHIKIESRGLVYLDEVRNIHRAIIKKSREVYENTIVDVPDMEEKDIIKIIKTDLEKFLLQKIDREPMIIPIIAEV